MHIREDQYPIWETQTTLTFNKSKHGDICFPDQRCCYWHAKALMRPCPWKLHLPLSEFSTALVTDKKPPELLWGSYAAHSLHWLANLSLSMHLPLRRPSPCPLLVKKRITIISTSTAYWWFKTSHLREWCVGMRMYSRFLWQPFLFERLVLGHVQIFYLGWK